MPKRSSKRPVEHDPNIIALRVVREFNAPAHSTGAPWNLRQIREDITSNVTPNRFNDLRSHAAAALQRLRHRQGENIEAWAEGLIADVRDLND